MDKLRAYYLSSTGSKIKAAATISNNNDAVSYLSNRSPDLLNAGSSPPWQ